MSALVCHECDGRGWTVGFGEAGDPADAACRRCQGDSPPPGVVGYLTRKADVDWRQLLAVTEVGSTLHGVADVEVAGDRDFLAVYVDTPYDLVWRPSLSAKMARTAPEGERSQPSDVDLVLYPLRHFVNLCLRGNPSILNVLYAASNHVPWWVPDWPNLRARIRDDCLAAHPAAEAYGGYMDRQLERWRGTRGQKNVSRPDLVDKYGYDVKYAFHAIRLGIQGTEYLLTGHITLPVPEPDRSRLLAIRTGQVDEADAWEWAQEVREGLREAALASPLRPEPEYESLRHHVADYYMRRLGR